MVAKLKIKTPAIIQKSADGISCGYQTYVKNDNYFNLMVNRDFIDSWFAEVESNMEKSSTGDVDDVEVAGIRGTFQVVA